MVQKLQHLYGYDALNCCTSDPGDLNDNSGRTDKQKGVLRPLSFALTG
jgi:type I restriction enzyme R subunit